MQIGVVGGTGYAGRELLRLLARHPAAPRVIALERGDIEGGRGDGVVADCDVIMLATPAEVSHALVPTLARKVIDLSGAFRLRDAQAYTAHYGFAHRHVGLLAEAVYGLPERDRERVRGARLVANPGCYATAIQLALAPILPLVTGRIVVDAMSGVTGAGRKATLDLSFAEVANDLRAYRVLRHQHEPEIEQGLGVDITFVPHVLPVQRGILATCHAQLAPGHTRAEVATAFETAYAREPFVVLAPSADAVGLHDVVGTNACRIGFALEGDQLVAIAAIDNLIKGAAGQAVQNLNLMLGWPEQAGLAELRSFYR